MTTYRPLASFGGESARAAPVRLPTAPWEAGYQDTPQKTPVEDAPASQATTTPKTPAKPASGQHSAQAAAFEAWYAMQMQDLARAEKRVGMLPQTQPKAGGRYVTGRKAVAGTKLMAIIRAHGPVTSVDLANLTGGLVSSMSSALAKLEKRGRVRRVGMKPRVGQKGLPLVIFEAAE